MLSLQAPPPHHLSRSDIVTVIYVAVTFRLDYCSVLYGGLL